YAQQPAPPRPAPVPSASRNPAVTAPKPNESQGVLSATVVEKGTKLPLNQIQVSIIGSESNEIQTVTDEDGKIVVPVAPGGYRLTLRRVGQIGNLGVPLVKMASVQKGEQTKLQIEIPPTAEVSGRVLDPRGEPVANARVTLLLHAYEA